MTFVLHSISIVVVIMIVFVCFVLILIHVWLVETWTVLASPLFVLS